MDKNICVEVMTAGEGNILIAAFLPEPETAEPAQIRLYCESQVDGQPLLNHHDSPL